MEESHVSVSHTPTLSHLLSRKLGFRDDCMRLISRDPLWVPPEVKTCRKQVREAIEEGKLDVALQILNNMIDQHPECHLSYMDRACVHFLSSKVRDGMDDLHASLRVSPSYIDDFPCIAQSQLRVERRKAALGISLFLLTQSSARLSLEPVMETITIITKGLFSTHTIRSPQSSDSANLLSCPSCSFPIYRPVVSPCGHTVCGLCAPKYSLCFVCKFPAQDESPQTCVASNRVSALVNPDAVSYLSKWLDLSQSLNPMQPYELQLDEKLLAMAAQSPEFYPAHSLVMARLSSQQQYENAIIVALQQLRRHPANIDVALSVCDTLSAAISTLDEYEKAEGAANIFDDIILSCIRVFLSNAHRNVVVCSTKRQVAFQAALQPLINRLIKSGAFDRAFCNDWPATLSTDLSRAISTVEAQIQQSVTNPNPSNAHADGPSEPATEVEDQSQPAAKVEVEEQSEPPTEVEVEEESEALHPTPAAKRLAMSPPKTDLLTPCSVDEISQHVREQILEELNCVLCMELIWQPVTTSCGHTFCRSCLSRTLDHRNSCPQCRSDLQHYINPEMQCTDFFLLDFMKAVFPGELEERKISFEKEMEQQKQFLPIFVCSLLLPSLECPLHIFEPRYRLMVRRAMESGERRFGMILHPGPWEPDGQAIYGTTAEIRSVDLLEDGRSLIDAYGGRRFMITNRSVQDGYMVAQVKWIDDEDLHPTTPEDIANPARNRNHLQTRLLLNIVRRKANEILATVSRRSLEMVEQQNGPMPGAAQVSEFLYWFINILPIHPVHKYRFLKLQSVYEVCIDSLSISLSRSLYVYIHALASRNPL
eukprot:TRINITY_DN1415_c0_g1_i2.p1 TRINITY_DN1415_c0_g1~~TRINITY_DN1415_c0_g1_i2.p1  ORF type:complete len:821 (-),score=155.97 TRINITY_DN1415_c0_g1_i2:424-2886(-)